LSADAGILLIGGGGHAKVIIGTLRAAGLDAAAVFDDNPARWGSSVLGTPVLGPVASIPDHPFRRGIVAIGDNRVRRTLAETVSLEWFTAVHPAAVVDPSVRIGAGTVVFAGAILQPEAVVGDHAVINTGVIIEHDCVVGSFAQVASGGCLAGGVRIGEGAMLGVGVSVIPGVRIGAWTTVGAGSVVVRDQPDGVVAYGVPARPRRSV
jgi:sugar O-acyltransferase (sialic acid O-acetyltransferase NeuD family)